MNAMYKKIRAKYFAIVVLVMTLLPLSMTHAQGSLQDGIENAGKVDDTLQIIGAGGKDEVVNYIMLVIEWLLSFVAVLALAALIWGAISYILSLGEDAKVQKAKNVIKAAVIGLILAGVSFLIITVIETLLTS